MYQLHPIRAAGDPNLILLSVFGLCRSNKYPWRGQSSSYRRALLDQRLTRTLHLETTERDQKVHQIRGWTLELRRRVLARGRLPNPVLPATPKPPWQYFTLRILFAQR